MVAVGSDVTRFEPGDEVFGIGKGSFAEFAAAREDKLTRETLEPQLRAGRGRTGLRDDRAARTLRRRPLAGGAEGSDRRRLRRCRHLRRADRQGARSAEVTGVCSTSKLDLVRSIGADHVIDYSQDEFADGEKRYDLILDIGGNTALSLLRRALTLGARSSSSAAEDGGRWIGVSRQLRALALSPFVGQRLTALGPKEHYTFLERLIELIESGRLVPVIEQTYPLDEMPTAMRHLVAGRARGKLVIAVQRDDVRVTRSSTWGVCRRVDVGRRRRWH